MAIKQATEIPTIDVVRVSVLAVGGTDEYVLNTSSKIAVEPTVETTDAVKLIIKGILKAQKKETNTLIGNKITLTDNVFTPEVVQIFQGGTVTPGSTALGTGDAGLLAVSKDIAKVINITLIDPMGNDAVLAVTVSGNNISVSLATGPAGALTSTASAVKAAIEALPAAHALVTLTLAGTGASAMVAKSITRVASPVGSYTPPVIGSDPSALPLFTLKAYSAQYNAAGSIVQYECIEYPSCSGTPIAMSSEDGAFRAPEYTINSNPEAGQAPYLLTYITALPAIA